MHRGNWLATGLVALAVVLAVVLAGCGTQAAGALDSPSRTVPVKGTNLSLVILTPEAARRIGLRTATVQPGPAATGGVSEAVPLAAVVYLSDGTTWVYAVTAKLTYERQHVTIASISGDTAMLQAGPAPGTPVVVVGAAELLGSEYGVAGGQ
jgi:hypothetical protein